MFFELYGLIVFAGKSKWRKDELKMIAIIVIGYVLIVVAVIALCIWVYEKEPDGFFTFIFGKVGIFFVICICGYCVTIAFAHFFRFARYLFGFGD